MGLMIAQGLQFLIVHRVARRHYDMQIPLKPLALNLMVAGAGVGIAYIFRQGSPAWDIALKAGICALCGAILLALLWREPAARARLLQMMSARRRPAVT